MCKAVCENCGAACEYDSDLCLCKSCEQVAQGKWTWRRLYEALRYRIATDKSFGDEPVTVYCAGSGEYFPVDDVCVAGEDDNVVDPDMLLIVIQN